MSWFSDAWDSVKSFAKAHPVLTSTVAAVATFVAVAAVVAVAAPVLAAAAGVALTAGAVTAISVGTAGVVSGVVGYMVGQGLANQPVTAKGLLVSGALSGVISLATLGLGSVLSPVVSRGVTPVIARVGLSEATTAVAARVATNGGVGGILGAGTKVVENAVSGRPLLEGVPQATATGVGLGMALPPIQNLANNAVARATGLPAPSVEPVRAPTPRPQQPLIDAQVQGRYLPDRIFMDYVPKDIPSEGWKLHISASPEHAGEVADTVLPVLRDMGVAHKIVGNIDNYVNVMTGTQTGKLVTIYPDSPAQAKAIVDALDPLLASRGLTGPVVSGEMPLGNSGLFFGRYGGFTKSTVTDPATGREVQDVRGQMAPPWVSNPFAPSGAGGPSAPSRTQGITGALGGG
jgi:hypothetical protein